MYSNAGRDGPPPLDIRLDLSVRVPLRDGATLGGALYRPAGVGPVPTLVILTPYTAGFHHEAARFFAENGYGFLAVDIRGRGASDGTLLVGAEGRDGFDVVEWVARQPFCNGKVGMWGGSYAGYAQWMTAGERPPHLAAIMPVAAPMRGLDSPMRTNIVPTDRVPWLAFIHGRAAQERLFADTNFWTAQYLRWFHDGVAFRDLPVSLGLDLPAFQEWLDHPHLGAYWDGLNPSSAQYAAIDIPVLTVTGAYDADQLGALAHYRAHPSDKHFLIIGPWDHGGTRRPRPEIGGLQLGPASLVDTAQLDLDWYGWTMGGGSRPAFLADKVAYYVTGAETWRYAGHLDQVTSRHASLFLSATGLHRAPPDTDGQDVYVYDPTDTSLAALEAEVDPASLVDQRLVRARAGRQLVYDSAPFDRDTEISGFFRLEAWLSIDKPDTDFQVRIYQVAVDGAGLLLAKDMLRARYRESLREPRLVATTEPLRYDFAHFNFVARRVTKGSRLRLVLGPVDSIFWQKNHNSGGEVAAETFAHSRPVTVALVHGPGHPSVLHVPIGAAG